MQLVIRQLFVPAAGNRGARLRAHTYIFEAPGRQRAKCSALNCRPASPACRLRYGRLLACICMHTHLPPDLYLRLLFMRRCHSAHCLPAFAACLWRSWQLPARTRLQTDTCAHCRALPACLQRLRRSRMQTLQCVSCMRMRARSAAEAVAAQVCRLARIAANLIAANACTQIAQPLSQDMHAECAHPPLLPRDTHAINAHTAAAPSIASKSSGRCTVRRPSRDHQQVPP